MCDDKQVAAYSKAECAAKEKLSRWDEVVAELTTRGFTEREIAREKKRVELNARGIFR